MFEWVKHVYISYGLKKDFILWKAHSYYLQLQTKNLSIIITYYFSVENQINLKLIPGFTILS